MRTFVWDYMVFSMVPAGDLNPIALHSFEVRPSHNGQADFSAAAQNESVKGTDAKQDLFISTMSAM